MVMPHDAMHPNPPTAAMRDVLARIARAGRPALHELPADQARQAYEAGAGVLDIAPVALARVQDSSFAADDGHRVPVRVYAPSTDVLPVVVYFHGGGFTVGSIDTHDALCRALASLSGCAVVSVGYRLAPAHRFPQAHDDAWAAVRWVADQGHLLGLDASRLAVAGDSAGATLSIACAVMARDHGLPLRGQVLFYPGCAGHMHSRSHQLYGTGHVLERPVIEWFCDQYTDAHHRTDWRFAPLLLDDAAGLAPTWIGLAELDPLHDEGMEWADRLRMAGVPVQLEVYRGVTHEFIKMGRIIPQARQAHQDAARAIQGALQA